jgi:hypothetical protein
MRQPLFLKLALFAKIHLNWAYLIFVEFQKTEYILKKWDLKPGFLEIRDYWAIKDKIRP